MPTIWGTSIVRDNVRYENTAPGGAGQYDGTRSGRIGQQHPPQRFLRGRGVRVSEHLGRSETCGCSSVVDPFSTYF
jgi:hypothetical protein